MAAPESPTSIFSQKLDRAAFTAYFLGAIVPLIALADCAGTDGTLVNKLEVRGLGKDKRVYTFASEGRVADPRSLVNDILKGLERGDDRASAVRN